MSKPILFVLSVCFGLTLSPRLLAENPLIPLSIEGHRLDAEIAHTYDTRAKGLMNRAAIPENQGMLFVFPKIDFYSMWMLNTVIPLSVAFIDAQGIILNIETMQPLTTFAHGSLKPAKYALEMNSSWFLNHNIKAGQSIIGLDKVPDAID